MTEVLGYDGKRLRNQIGGTPMDDLGTPQNRCKYIDITTDNIDREHLCCAIADKKHQEGVSQKKEWLKGRLKEGHVFRKLDAKGKVFIEYAPLEIAWVPITGENYIYIHCLWVSGSFSGQGHGKVLLSSCIDDAKSQGKAGVCVITSKKKSPFLSDRKFLAAFGFETVDSIEGGYELMAISLDNPSNGAGGAKPRFTESARQMRIDDPDLTIYYSPQCPYINNCIEQVTVYCKQENVPFKTIPVDTLEKAKNVPGVFNNWAVFHDHKFQTVHLLNEGYLKKLLGI